MSRIAAFRPIVGTILIALAAPALAQEAHVAPRPEIPQDVYQDRRDNFEQGVDKLVRERLSKSFNASGMAMGKDELKALRDLEKAINSPDTSHGVTAAEKAAAVVKGPDARFVLGALQLQLAAKRNDLAMQSAATDMVIASGVAPATVLPRLLRNQASFALDSNNMVKAEAAFIHLVQLAPTDADATISLAQVKNNLGKPKEALPLFDEAIRLKKASGQPVPDVWVRAATATRGRVNSGS